MPLINAYIFVRQGSKGLPNKNRLILQDKPLYAHSVLAAKQANIFQNVYVSTDDEVIALQASALCEVIHRPDNLCQDDSPEWLSWQHAIEHSSPCEVFMSVPATCPLRLPQDIIDTAAMLIEGQHHPVTLTVTPATHNPFYVGVQYDMAEPHGLRRIGHTDDLIPLRRQESPEVYNVCGVAYAAFTDYVRSAGGIWDCRPSAVVIPQERALDIDTEWDFKVAGWALAERQRIHKNSIKHLESLYL